MVDTGDVRLARGDAGGDHDLIEATVDQAAGVGPGVQLQVDLQHLDHPGVVAKGLGELLLAGDLLRQVELSADLACGLEQGDPMAALGGDGGVGQARRPRADHGDGPGRCGLLIDQLGLVAGPGID